MMPPNSVESRVVDIDDIFGNTSVVIGETESIADRQKFPA